MDIKYNYLINGNIDIFPNDFSIDERIDPDSSSEKLNNDIITAFFSKTKVIENFKQQYKSNPLFYTIRCNNGTLLSSDYIGPSVYWAREMGIGENKIRAFLKSCRTIGGHIVWQRGNDLKYKVNTARGGNNGVYDRFDWTLLLLKLYMNNPQDEDTFIKKSNLLVPEDFRNTKNVNDKFSNLFRAFACSEWLKSYSFIEFCQQFKLCGNFVDAQYEVIPMAPLFPILPNNYESYIDNVCKAINKRNAIVSLSVSHLL